MQRERLVFLLCSLLGFPQGLYPDGLLCIFKMGSDFLLPHQQRFRASLKPHSLRRSPSKQCQ